MISISDAKAKLPALVGQLQSAQESGIVLTRHGKPVAKLVSVNYPAPSLLDWHQELQRIHKYALKSGA